ncbi:MAG: hypothetical protein P4L86_07220 [Mycobacterium sp.]|nr:hypothetical protein [Mycobacterium sp.]
MRWSTLLTTPLLAVAIAIPAHAYTDTEIESAVTDTCQDSVKKLLRDPDSAKFSDWSAWEVLHSSKSGPDNMTFDKSGGDRWFEAAGQVNTKNGYGGYAGPEGYYCDAVVSTDGNVHALAKSADELLTPPTQSLPPGAGLATGSS